MAPAASFMPPPHTHTQTQQVHTPLASPCLAHANGACGQVNSLLSCHVVLVAPLKHDHAAMTRAGLTASPPPAACAHVYRTSCKLHAPPPYDTQSCPPPHDTQSDDVRHAHTHTRSCSVNTHARRMAHAARSMASSRVMSSSYPASNMRHSTASPTPPAHTMLDNRADPHPQHTNKATLRVAAPADGACCQVSSLLPCHVVLVSCLKHALCRRCNGTVCSAAPPPPPPPPPGRCAHALVHGLVRSTPPPPPPYTHTQVHLSTHTQPLSPHPPHNAGCTFKSKTYQHTTP